MGAEGPHHARIKMKKSQTIEKKISHSHQNPKIRNIKTMIEIRKLKFYTVLPPNLLQTIERHVTGLWLAQIRQMALIARHLMVILLITCRMFGWCHAASCLLSAHLLLSRVCAALSSTRVRARSLFSLFLSPFLPYSFLLRFNLFCSLPLLSLACFLPVIF